MLHQKNRRSAKLRLKTVKKWGVLSITIHFSTVVVTLLVEYQRCQGVRRADLRRGPELEPHDSNGEQLVLKCHQPRPAAYPVN